MDTVPGQTFLTRPMVAARYSISERSVSRWTEDKGLGFPQPIRVRDRLFFALDELETWERAQASRKAAA